MNLSPWLDGLGTAALGGHGVVVLAFTIVVFALFVWDRLPIASVCLGILVFLPLFFLLFPTQTDGRPVAPAAFFAGFGHPALVAITALMVLGHALVVTGALEPVARGLSGHMSERPRLTLLAVLAGAMAVSGVINDTPLVVLLIPLLLAASRRAGTSPAGVLMPMNFAVLIGGMSTTIGTSTNLIVASLSRQHGGPALGVFDFSPLVLAAAVPALLYLWLVAPRLLRTVPAPTGAHSEAVFEAELRVEPGSGLDGQELRRAFEVTKGRLQVLEVRDAQGRERTRLPTLPLRAGDRLVLQDTVEHLKEFEELLKVRLHDLRSEQEDEVSATVERETLDEADEAPGAAPPAAVVAQLVVTPASPMVGRTVRQMQLVDRYRLVAVGLRPARARRGKTEADLGDRRLQPGDILLLQGAVSSLQAAQQDGLGLLLDARHLLPRQQKARLALGTLAVVVLLAATKLLPIEVAALGGVLALLLLHGLTWRDIGHAVSTKVILLVASSLALGQALQLTGGTGFLAAQLVRATQGLDAAWVLAMLIGVMGVLTNFVSNNAAAAVGTPLGLEMARQLGVPPEPFVLGVLFGCNLCYATPMGYQTNLLVMNAAGYRFSDFVKAGGPLFLLMWGVLSLLLAWRYAL